MAFVFEMPEVGEGVVEAEVAEWKVAIGDAVQVDQPLCEITTDKASLEISSPKAGTIVKLYGEPGDIIAVHTPLVEIDLDGTAVAAAPAPAKAAPAPKAPPAPTATPAPTPQVAAPVPPPAPPSAPPSRVGPARATPAVRRRARELGIDLHGVAGTGPGGRITHGDLDNHGAAPAPAPASRPVAIAAPAAEDERIKIIGIRRRIAQRMQHAKQTAAHFTYVEEIDCTRLVDTRNRLKGRAAELGIKLTYLPFFAKACSVAFRDFPQINATIDEEAGEMVLRAHHHIGFACDTPNGLLVPVVRHIERKSILAIATELADLFARTQQGQASRDELSGSTFTITGVGSIGGVMATPILNLPEVAILGTNQIRKRAVVTDDDQIVVRPMSYLSPTFDHRFIDGAVAARFVRRLKDLLENPEALMLVLA